MLIYLYFDVLNMVSLQYNSLQVKKIEKHVALKQNIPIRLSDYVPGIFQAIVSKKGMKKAIESGLVTVDGQAAYTSTYINGGEIIVLHKKDSKHALPTIDLELEVLFEDDYLAILNKPAGIVVSGNKLTNIVNALPTCLQPSPLPDALERPMPAHRLDFATSGVLLIGKTAQGLTALNKLFENKKITKTYNAITIGKMPESGLQDDTIKNKKATTAFKVLQKIPSPKFGFINVVELKPTTGRRHQLRIHMNTIGNPILGDQTYFKEGQVLKGKGLFLHALSLDFIHPFTDEKVSVTAELPAKFVRIINNTIGRKKSEEEE